jgi:hypothetical protein
MMIYDVVNENVYLRRVGKPFGCLLFLEYFVDLKVSYMGSVYI